MNNCNEAANKPISKTSRLSTENHDFFSLISTLVAIKAYFTNEIYELKREINQLKGQEKTRKCDGSESTWTEILKSQMCYFARTKFFYKIRVATKTNNYWKLLDINKNQIKETVPVMESIKVTKGKLKQIIVIKWFISLVK